MAADRRIYLLKGANKLFRQGKIEPALEEYKKILIIKPDDLEVRRIVGDIQVKRNNIPEAIEQYDWIADYYVKEGFFVKASAMYKKIIRLVPGQEGAKLKLAELYAEHGLIMESKQIYLGILEKCQYQSNREKILDIYKKTLEKKEMNQELKDILEELLQLSDTPSSYEEQPAKLTGQQEKKEENADIGIDFESECSEVGDMEIEPELLPKLEGDPEPMELEAESDSINEDLFEIESSMARELEDSGEDVTVDHSSPDEDIDLDNILVGSAEESVPDFDDHFKEMSSPKLAFDWEEDLLQEEDPFSDDEE
jgi:tetratricopeptide (TPR) repeat protein